MAKLERQSTPTGFLGHPPHGDASGIDTCSTPPARAPDDSDDDRPVGGISVIPIPRRVIARLTGTLRLGGLPRHKPTIVFGPSGPSRDVDDE
jgi:hypothetical protein